jgi:hypothetical protein
MSEVITVRLAPEWVTGPLWVYRTGEPAPDNYSPEEFATEFDLPADLVADLDAWDAEFQAVYDDDDPAGSEFPSEAAMTAWEERGEQLARRLAAALRRPVELRTATGNVVFDN